MTGKGEDLYTDSLYDLSLEEKIRQLERQSSYERLARLELSVENERLRAELSDLYPAIESLRDELQRAKAEREAAS
jgi:ABC-type phosphate transport system auxiliary subunit